MVGDCAYLLFGICYFVFGVFEEAVFVKIHLKFSIDHESVLQRKEILDFGTGNTPQY